jgi:hypothetical protein
VRHQYVPVFRDLLASNVWEEPAPTRCVWFWFMLMADPEGFVAGTLGSVSRGANVSRDEARDALEYLTRANPESRGTDEDGRMLEVVARGWRVVNLEKWRELAKAEAQRAHNRRYMQRVRGVDVESSGGDVEAPKPKPKPKPIPKPVASQPPEEPSVIGVTFDKLPAGYQPSQALEVDALAAGVPREWLIERINGLRGRKIGGNTPITDIEEYLRGLLPSWRRWYETDQAKRSRSGPPGDAGPPRPRNAPPWVHADHAELALKLGVDVVAAAKRFAKEHQLHRSEPPAAELFRMFRQYLERSANDRSTTAA